MQKSASDCNIVKKKRKHRKFFICTTWLVIPFASIKHIYYPTQPLHLKNSQ